MNGNISPDIPTVNIKNTLNSHCIADDEYVTGVVGASRERYAMGRPPTLPEDSTRKNLTLSNVMWAELNEERKRSDGAVPSEMDLLRALLREALDARYAARERVKPSRKAKP